MTKISLTLPDGSNKIVNVNGNPTDSDVEEIYNQLVGSVSKQEQTPLVEPPSGLKMDTSNLLQPKQINNTIPNNTNRIQDILNSINSGFSFGQRALFPIAQKIMPELTKEEYTKFNPNMDYEPKTLQGKIAKVGVEALPYGMLPEFKALPSLLRSIVGGGIAGGISGGAESLEKKGLNPQENIKDILDSGETGSVLGGILNPIIPFGMQAIKGLSKSIPEAIVSLMGIRPKSLYEAIENPHTKKLISFPEKYGNEDFLNKISKNLKNSLKEYENTVQTKAQNMVLDSLKESGYNIHKPYEEYRKAFNDALATSGIYRNGQFTPTGSELKPLLKKFNNAFDYYLKEPTLDNLLGFRQLIDNTYALWEKPLEKKAGADIARISLASSVRKDIDESIKALSSQMKARDKKIIDKIFLLENPDIKTLTNTIKTGKIDAISNELKKLSSSNGESKKALQRLSDAFREEGIDIFKPTGGIIKALDRYRIASGLDKPPINMFGKAQAIRHAIGAPLIKSTIVPIAKNKTARVIGKGIAKSYNSLEKFFKSPLSRNTIIPQTIRSQVNTKYDN